MTVLTAPVRLLPSLHVVYSEYPHVDSGNVYLISGERPTLIDGGSPRAAPQLVRNLAQLGLAPGDLHQVLLTHGDYDHVQGVHALRRQHHGLRLRIHPLDLPIVIDESPWANASYLYGQPFVPLDPDLCLEVRQGDVIPAGDTALTVHHAPGHTEGSVCYHGTIDGVSVLFAGDAIGGAMHSLTDADLESWAQAVAAWERSLGRLARLPFAWVLNGHEPAATLPLERPQVDRLLRGFGKMLNPWFLLAEEDLPAPARSR